MFESIVLLSLGSFLDITVSKWSIFITLLQGENARVWQPALSPACCSKVHLWVLLPEQVALEIFGFILKAFLSSDWLDINSAVKSFSPETVQVF